MMINIQWVELPLAALGLFFIFGLIAYALDK